MNFWLRGLVRQADPGETSAFSLLCSAAVSLVPNEAKERLEKLSGAFSRPGRRGIFWGSLSFALLGAGIGAEVARAGTVPYRLAAAGLIVAPLAVLFWLTIRARRQRRAPELMAARAVSSVDESQAKQLTRALGLARQIRERPSGESQELADVHLSRVLGGVSLEAVEKSGQRRGRRLSLLAGGLLVAVVFLLMGRGFSMVEGLDILLARGGLAPWTIPYLEEVDVQADPPSYLPDQRHGFPIDAAESLLPAGSEVEYRMVPRVSGRSFVLTDGVREEPFVSDGQGSMVARMQMTDPATLRVAAKFGPVRIFHSEDLTVATLEDHPPSVVLNGAPKEIPLDDMQRLELEFLAQDDYGLTSVELVLRSGRREERKELVQLDGQERVYRGGYALTSQHPFLEGAFLPVAVTIEARDNNSVGEVGRGKSEILTLLPRPLGSLLGERHVALRKFREKLVAFLSSEMAAARLSPRAAREKEEEALSELESALAQLEKSLSADGEVPRGSLQFLEAQLDALRSAEGKRKAESTLLAADVLMSELSRHDAKTVAEDLAAAVEEIAARMRGQDVSREELGILLEAAFEGAALLGEIGELGLDLGSVARADLERVRQLVEQVSYSRARAAALHLAARLRRGTPSFGAKGAGVEAGTRSPGRGDAPASPSTAPSEYDQLAREADELAQEHAQELSALERLLEEAGRAAASDAARDPQVDEVTDRLRSALQRLPGMARFPGTADAEAARGRNLGEAMADALESGRARDAIEQGRAALESLRRSEELLPRTGGFVDGESLRAAQKAVTEALSAAREAQEQGRKTPEMRQRLEERAARERELARRAEELSERSSKGEAPLPDKSVRGLRRAASLMKESAQAMQRGDADTARELSGDAQRQLERAQPESREGHQKDTGPQPGEGRSPQTGRADVPDEATDPARDFRERVERGLGRRAGRLGPAVRRYAEELK